MKYIVTLLFIAGIFNFPLLFFTSAQVCSPDPQYTNGGLFPDSVTDLDTAYFGTPYTQLMTVVVPPDTPMAPPPIPAVPIDSIILVSLNNLPPGLSYACNNSRCSFKGNSKDCALVSGTPTSVGVYDISGTVNAYLGGSPSPTSYALSNYRIVVKAAQSISENELKNNLMIFPIPAMEEINILFYSKKTGMAAVRMFNAIGKEVLKMNTAVINGINKIAIRTISLPDGLYYLTIGNKDEIYSKRITKFSSME